MPLKIIKIAEEPLFAANVVSSAVNVVLRPPLFAANVVSRIALFAV